MKSMQSNGHRLADCRDELNALIEAVLDDKGNANSALYGCRLVTKYISPNAAIVKSPHFERAVVKLQRGLENELTDVERSAVVHLRMQSISEPEPVTNNGLQNMKERMAKKRNVGHEENEYPNFDFILGSVARVNRLWSIAKYVSTYYRRHITPQLFEAWLFLCEKERYWDAGLVAKSISSARCERVKARMNAHDELDTEDE